MAVAQRRQTMVNVVINVTVRKTVLLSLRIWKSLVYTMATTLFVMSYHRSYSLLRIRVY